MNELELFLAQLTDEHKEHGSRLDDHHSVLHNHADHIDDHIKVLHDHADHIDDHADCLHDHADHIDDLELRVEGLENLTLPELVGAVTGAENELIGKGNSPEEAKAKLEEDAEEIGGDDDEDED